MHVCIGLDARTLHTHSHLRLSSDVQHFISAFHSVCVCVGAHLFAFSLMNLIHLLFSCPLPHLCLCSYGLVLLIVNKFGFFAHPIWVKCGVNPCLTIAVVMVVGRRHLFLLLLLSFPRLVKSFSRLDWRRTFAKLILPSVCELNLGSPTSANTAGCTRTLVSGRRHSLPLLIKRRRHTGNFDCNVFFLFSRFWFNFPFS